MAGVSLATMFVLPGLGRGLKLGVEAATVGVEGAEGLTAGRTVLRELDWTSKSVRDAAKALQGGAREVSVASKAEAEELFLGCYQSLGYRNTTGWSPMEVKNFFGQKAGTYHWDLGEGAFPHDFSHLQIHSIEGPVLRIYFPGL
jgi:hypothetical protein